MDARELTPTYHVTPQIDPADAGAIAEAGYTLVICNRPDAENPPSHQADAMRAALEAEGLRFEVLPLTHQTMTPENVARQKALMDGAEGKVLAYCASGTRSSVVWALGQAPERDVDEILGACGRAGYALEALRPALNDLSQRG